MERETKQFTLLPFVEPLRSYTTRKLRADLVAGLTVALVALPQSLAYALIAGIDPKYGIYAAIVASIVGALFGSSRHLHTGPVNAISIVTAAAMARFSDHPDFMGIIFLLAWLTGLFNLGAGLLKLGNLTQFISRSVLAGFMSGAALLIIINQMPNLLGLPTGLGGSALDNFSSMLDNLNGTDITTFAIGLGTIFFVVTLNLVSPKSSSGVPYVPSYLLAVLVAAAGVALFGSVNTGIRVVGAVPASLPSLSAPSLDLATIKLLAASALALALISISEALASAKSIASIAGDKIQANQELVGQGMSNLAVAFFSGMPVSGSFTRTVLNYKAGARTRFAAVYSGIILLAIIVLFGPVTKFIPVAALAGIIMVIAIQMVNWQQIKLSLKTTKSDAVVMLATFAATLVFTLDAAIYVGVGLSLILFLRKAQHPRLIELVYDEANGFQEMKKSHARHFPEISIVHIEGDVFFGGAEFLENEIGRIAKREGLKALILRMKSSSCLDATSISSLIQFSKYMKENDKLLIVSGVTGEVETIFRRSGLAAAIGEKNLFFSDATVLKSTREALGRALEYVGGESPEEVRLRLFYDRPEKAQLPS